MNERHHQSNERLLRLESLLFNQTPHIVDSAMMQSMMDFGMEEEKAYSILVASALGLDINENSEDMNFWMDFFTPCITKMNPELFRNDPYMRTIQFPHKTKGNIELTQLSYSPYEAFPCGDMHHLENGMLRAPMGFFSEEYTYPAIKENGREWMTLIPNEIITCKPAIEAAFGKVITFGLGLGYYPFMVSEKENVEKITIVELNPDIVNLFQEEILPQFPHKEKVEVICANAFDFLEDMKSSIENNSHLGLCKNVDLNFDVFFGDIWHDVSDGIPAYEKMKSYEYLLPKCLFTYWIEPSMKCYIL